MSKRIRAAVIAADAELRPEDPAIEMIADPINEGSEMVRELRANLRAQGITGDAQDGAVATAWAARNR